MRISTQLNSPVGWLLITEENDSIVAVDFLFENHSTSLTNIQVEPSMGETTLLTAAKRQLSEYFDGTRTSFNLPLKPNGTLFQKKCWSVLEGIPYGTTISYGDEAERVGGRNYCRAVGMANGKNPIPIIIPCHRVIGSNGKLTGYSSGLDIKQRLLQLEGITLHE